MRDKVIWFLLYALLCTVILVIFVQDPGFNNVGQALLKDMVYGEAKRPYVYRTLLPTTVRLITLSIPEATRESIIERMRGNNLVMKVFNKLDWEIEYFIEYIISCILMYLTLLGFCYAIRYLFKGVYLSTKIFTNITPLIALVCLPPFFKYTNYIWDFPTLMFSALLLGLMVREKFHLFYIIFPLSCINKETTILMSMVFAIHFYKEGMNKSHLAIHLLCQLAVFTVIKTIINIIFIENRGGLVEFQLLVHNYKVLTAYSIPTLVAWIAVVASVIHKWREKPPFLKRGLWIMVPLFVASIFFAFIDELRDFYDAFPIFFLLFIYSLGHILGIEIKSTPAGSPAEKEPSANHK